MDSQFETYLSLIPNPTFSKETKMHCGRTRPLQIVLEHFKKIATKPVKKFFKSVKNWKRYDRISKSCHILMLFVVNVCESRNIN